MLKLKCLLRLASVPSHDNYLSRDLVLIMRIKFIPLNNVSFKVICLLGLGLPWTIQDQNKKTIMK